MSSGELYKDGAKVKIQEQPFTVLALLLERGGELVTRDELREKLWPNDTFVDFNHGINVAVGKIREVLGDSADQPHYIETVGRRGYRFIAPTRPSISDTGSPGSAILGALPGASVRGHSVGRQKELAQLGAAFESVASGSGMLACVAGEPGIGKTTLVQDFLSGLQASGQRFRLAVGRCSQRLAGEEAYLPFLEALESLLRSDGDAALKSRQLAPTWYAQLFPLSETDPSDVRLQDYARTTTQERLKRELARLVCEVTRQQPLVLFFDDVHWTDPSTVDVLAHLATKFDSTRILVIATYRPSELYVLQHPFAGVKRELQTRGACQEIEVEFLSTADVERYIALEFPENSFPRGFAGVIHSRTEGNPLFMVDLLHYLRDREVIVKTDEEAGWRLLRSLPDLSRDIPRSVGNVIERKIEQLSDRDREILTAAAVQGYEFDSAGVARALQAESVEIEERLQRMERVNGFIKRVAEKEFPEGTLNVRYRFVHVLYQNALDASLAPTRRAALSGALASALESFYGEKASSIASELGFLYEAARNPERASNYFLSAAQNSAQMFANREAIALAQRGLTQLVKLPATTQRARRELDLQITLAFALLWTQGYASPETISNMDRARELCEAMGDMASLFSVLSGLWTSCISKSDLEAARETAERLSSIQHDLNDPAMRLGVHGALAFTFHHQGELPASRQEFEEVARLYDVTQRSRYVQLYRLDFGVHSISELIRTLWLLGFPDQARQKLEENLALARSLSSPLSLAFCQVFAGFLYQNLRQPEKAREIGAECIALCDDLGIMLERAWVECPFGWAIAELGQIEVGIAHIRTGLDTQLTIGAQVARPQFLAIFAETLCRAGRSEPALQAVEEGLEFSNRNGERYYDAELWRLKGELVKLQDKTEEAEQCFQKAIAISRQQAAKSLELRAATSLARLWQTQGKPKEAKQVLGDVYAWFTEGFDTADLRDAASLLDELS